MDSYLHRVHDNHLRSRVYGGRFEQVHPSDLGNDVSLAESSMITFRESDTWFLRHSLSVSDLTPNVGLSWYFFTEMFDHFRKFFTGVFQVSTSSPS